MAEFMNDYTCTYVRVRGRDIHDEAFISTPYIPHTRRVWRSRDEAGPWMNKANFLLAKQSLWDKNLISTSIRQNLNKATSLPNS